MFDFTFVFTYVCNKKDYSFNAPFSEETKLSFKKKLIENFEEN